jgi:endoglucanase
MASVKTGSEMAPTIMLAAHTDEIGVIVHYINDEGFLFFRTIGGWDPTVFVGQRVRLFTDEGEVQGVVGRPATHLMTFKEQAEKIEVHHLWLDIGAKDKAEAEKLVAIGTYGVLAGDPLFLSNNVIVGRAVDNRIGTFTILEALRQYKETNGTTPVTAVANRREEIGGPNGARNAAYKLYPTVAIVVDTTAATDQPGIDKQKHGETKMGSGPAIAIGAEVDAGLAKDMMRIAKELKIPYTVEAVGTASWTDAGAVAQVKESIPTVLLSIPTRYLHTPVEMANLEDVENTIKLIVEFCRQF